MKNYSLIRRFGSNFGLITLSSSFISGIGSQNVSAQGSFLESKFFKSLYDLFSDDDLKDFNTNNFWYKLSEKDGKVSEDLKGKELVFLVKLKKFCDKKCNEESQQNEMERKIAANVSREIKAILNGNIEKKIDDFFKSKFFEKHIRAFANCDVPEQKTLIIKMLSTEEENYGEWFSKTPPSLFLHAFCSSFAEDLKTTGYTRFQLILYLWKVINISKEILSDKDYVKKLEEKEYAGNFFYFRVFASDLVKFKIFKAEDVHKIFLAFSEKNNQGFKSINKENIAPHKREGYFNKLIKGYSFYKLDEKKILIRLPLDSILDSDSKRLEETEKSMTKITLGKISKEDPEKSFDLILDKMSEEKSEKTVYTKESSKNEVLKEDSKESVRSVLDEFFKEGSEKKALDKIAEEASKKLIDLSLHEISEENLEKTAKPKESHDNENLKGKTEEETVESVLCKSFDKIYDDSDCNIQ